MDTKQNLMRLGAVKRLEELRGMIEDLQAEVDLCNAVIASGSNVIVEHSSNYHPASEANDTGRRRPGQYVRTETHKRAIGRRMRQYWASQRKGKGK